jgi:DNA-directed RNA polymerase specialized sigma24 family protein
MTEEEFEALRPSAFAIAYRMLGSVSEAEDVVQEGFLRLHRARQGGERIESARAYLSTGRVAARAARGERRRRSRPRAARVPPRRQRVEWLGELARGSACQGTAA